MAAAGRRTPGEAAALTARNASHPGAVEIGCRPPRRTRPRRRRRCPSRGRSGSGRRTPSAASATAALATAEQPAASRSTWEAGWRKPTPCSLPCPPSSGATRPPRSWPKAGWITEKVLDALSAPPEPSSLERSAGPAGDEERAELGAFLADDSPEASPTDRAVEALETARARRRLGKAIAGLKPQEHTTVIRRYGLDAAKPRKSSSRSLWRSAAPTCACGRSSALRRRGSRRGARRPGRLSAPKAFVHGSTRRGRFPATFRLEV